jgi:hypothetical protein
VFDRLVPPVEQRGFERSRLWLPVRLRTDAGEGLAVTYDVSEKGVLFLAATEVGVGARVTLSLDVPGSEPPRTLVATGTVVHCSPNAADPDGLWRHRVGVALDETLGELRRLVDDLAGPPRSQPASSRPGVPSSRPPSSRQPK